MKKFFLFFFTLIVFISCDPEFHDYYIISNKCNEKIEVDVTFSSGSNKYFEIQPNSESLFHTEEWIGGKSNIEIIDSIFENIVIKKGDSISPLNYANHTLWEKVNIESSRRNRYYTEVEYYLYVNPDDFINTPSGKRQMLSHKEDSVKLSH